MAPAGLSRPSLYPPIPSTTAAHHHLQPGLTLPSPAAASAWAFRVPSCTHSTGLRSPRARGSRWGGPLEAGNLAPACRRLVGDMGLGTWRGPAPGSTGIPGVTAPRSPTPSASPAWQPSPVAPDPPLPPCSRPTAAHPGELRGGKSGLHAGVHAVDGERGRSGRGAGSAQVSQGSRRWWWGGTRGARASVHRTCWGSVRVRVPYLEAGTPWADSASSVSPREGSLHDTFSSRVSPTRLAGPGPWPSTLLGKPC